MTRGSDIFKIKSNSILPDKGKVLIFSPIISDIKFTRSVVLLIDHGTKGSVGIIMNKPSKLIVNDIVKEFKYLDNIPLFKGGPVSLFTYICRYRRSVTHW